MSKYRDKRKISNHIILLSVIGLLSACGSSSSDDVSDSPAAFDLINLNASVEATGGIEFSWQASEHAASYQLCRKLADADDPCELIGVATESTHQTLSNSELHALKDSQYFVRASNEFGSQDSNEMSLDLNQLVASGIPLTASDSELKNTYGQSVALSQEGNVLAVGVPMDDDGDSLNLQDRGAVYVYSRIEDGSWSAPVILKASNIGGWDWFGGSLSLSDEGDVLAVGAIGESSNNIDDPSLDLVDQAGAVYVFQRDTTGEWTEKAYLKAVHDIDSTDSFGRSLSLSGDGNTLAVGVPYEDSVDRNTPEDNSLADSGAVYMFHRQEDDSWGDSQFLKSRFPDESGYFGHNLELSTDGMTLAVGEPNEGAEASGAVYIYERGQDGVWQSLTRLVADNEPRYESFGISLSLNSAGDLLAVGSDGNVGLTQGNVKLFFKGTNSTWNESATFTATEGSESDRFGLSVALSDDGGLLAVGAASEASGVTNDPMDNSADNAGAVYIFRSLGGGNWSEPDYLKAKDIQANSFFGKRIGLSGDGSTLAVGADGVSDTNDNRNSSISNITGSVFVY